MTDTQPDEIPDRVDMAIGKSESAEELAARLDAFANETDVIITHTVTDGEDETMKFTLSADDQIQELAEAVREFA